MPVQKNTLLARWAPTSHKWSCHPDKWPYNWVTGVISYNPYKWSYGPAPTYHRKAFRNPTLLSTWIVEGSARIDVQGLGPRVYLGMFLHEQLYVKGCRDHLIKMKASWWAMLPRGGGIRIPKYINLIQLIQLTSFMLMLLICMFHVRCCFVC